MMGTTLGPLDLKDCGSNSDPIVSAEWAIWNSDYVPTEPSAQFPPIAKLGSLNTRTPNLVAHGEIDEGCGCKFTDDYNYKMIAGFSLEPGKKYVAMVKFTKDGSALNAANPHLIVIRHTDMW